MSQTMLTCTMAHWGAFHGLSMVLVPCGIIPPNREIIGLVLVLTILSRLSDFAPSLQRQIDRVGSVQSYGSSLRYFLESSPPAHCQLFLLKSVLTSSSARNTTIRSLMKPRLLRVSIAIIHSVKHWRQALHDLRCRELHPFLRH